MELNEISQILITEPFLIDNIVEKDFLEIEDKVNDFIGKINKIDNGTIGLVSKAGSGKSFFLKRLYDFLRNNGEKNVIYIDISNYQEIDDIFILLISIILSEIDSNKGINDFLYFTKNYFGNIINTLDDSSKIKQSYKILKALLNVNETAATYKVQDKDKIDEFLRKYNKNLKEKKHILIIDNLEKCSPEYVIKFFLFTRKIIDKNILIILSYDKFEITNALQNFYGNNFNTQNFFRKFILLEFYLEKYYENISKLIEKILPEDFNWGMAFNQENIKSVFENIYKEKEFELSLRLLIMLIHKFVFFKDNLDGENIKYFLILIIYKFICEVGYEKIYYENQRNKIDENLNFLDENEKNKFEKVKNIVFDYVQVGSRKFSFDELKDVFNIIEL